MNQNNIVQAIRDIANHVAPQYDIADLLYRHKCYYLLSLYNNKYSTLLRAKKFINTTAVKERYQTLIPFFDNGTVPYAVIKGAVLSKMAYNNESLRTSGDIDLLICKQDADQVKEMLHTCGFIQGRITPQGVVPFSRSEILFQTALSHQTAPYVKTTDNRLCPYVKVDINTDIMWGESTQKADMHTVLSHTEQAIIADISIHKLDKEMEFISLCLHHYKDMNSLYLLAKGNFCINLFCDIFFYLKANTPHKQMLSDLVKELQVGPYIYYCLLYTDQLFPHDDVITEYLTLFAEDKDELLLHSYGLDDSERKQWQISFFDRLLHESLSDYLQNYLTDQDRKKINSNYLYM